MTFDSSDIIAFLSYIGLISIGLCYVCLTFKLNNLDKYEDDDNDDDNNNNNRSVFTHSGTKSNVTSVESCPSSYNTTTYLNNRNYKDRVHKNGSKKSNSNASNSTVTTAASNGNDQK